MSRSFRKSPIFGRTSADSEKADKRAAHQRTRTVLRVALTDPESAADAPLPHPRSGRYDFAKDGKAWRNRAPREAFRK